jgi:hypothetical protein
MFAYRVSDVREVARLLSVAEDLGGFPASNARW